MIDRSAHGQILETNIPFPTVELFLGEPETVKRNLDGGEIISLCRWNCGCRAVAKGSICDVKWCARHGLIFGSRQAARTEP